MKLIAASAVGMSVLLASHGCGSPPAPDPPRVEKPNIILISLDTLRADHLGCYGYDRETSPKIDALASSGVLFESAIAQSSHTRPSHMSMFQSRYPTLTTDEHPMLAEILANHDYLTAAFTGGGKVAAKFGFDRGFGRYEEIPEGFEVAFPQIEEWLWGQKSGPFFLFVHTYDIHAPYDPDPPFDTTFSSGYDGALRAANAGRLLRQLIGKIEPDEQFEAITWNQQDRREMVALYDGGILQTDGYIGRLTALLDSLPTWNWDRDVLILLSDHGEEFWEHGSVAHGLTLYQEAIHVPLIIRVPEKMMRVQNVPGVTRLLDVAPTLLDLAGVELPPVFMGRSLLPVINGTEEDEPPWTAISQTTGKLESIIDHPWKLIARRSETDAELFDLSVDPSESTPMATKHHVERVEALRSSIRDLIRHQTDIPLDLSADEVEDEELLEQLRALGYVE
jgi:YD repeat-containing protein